ncbi:SDR family NAD(P)-dependent oxidoreductase [Thermodesulfobacteriota bacterium]
MSQKSVIIFGGSRGIGRVVAERFIMAGYNVTVAARTRSDIDEINGTQSAQAQRMGEGERRPPSMVGFVADITNYWDVRSVVTSHIDRWGRLDVAIDAAGVQDPIGPVWRNDPQAWQQTISINLIGAFYVCHEVMPYFLNKGKGAIILFSGGGSAYARPYFSAYGCGKTGVLRLAETLQAEIDQEPGYKGKIVAYAVAPGAVKTQMTEQVLACRDAAGAKACEEAASVMEAGGTPPEKAAELCLYLAEKRPRCLSGRLIHVNEPYRDYVARYEGKDIGDSGLLRRQPYRNK